MNFISLFLYAKGEKASDAIEKPWYVILNQQMISFLTKLSRFVLMSKNLLLDLLFSFCYIAT